MDATKIHLIMDHHTMRIIGHPPELECIPYLALEEIVSLEPQAVDQRERRAGRTPYDLRQNEFKDLQAILPSNEADEIKTDHGADKGFTRIEHHIRHTLSRILRHASETEKI